MIKLGFPNLILPLLSQQKLLNTVTVGIATERFEE